MINKQILTFGRYYKKKLGIRVRKIPINLSGFTCPNIDGTKAKGGCSFCENESFSPNLSKNKTKFYLSPASDTNPILDTQIKELKEQFNNSTKRVKKEKFIIYFQSFTNTYAPLQTLKILYENALRLPNVIGISIGTRADSIDDKTLIYLKELSQKHEIWIEYGVQSIYDTTLTKINRAEKSHEILSIIKKTKNMGIMVCAHLIFGLPNETQDMMLNTVEQVLKLKIDSIKFHPLYVVKNTALASSFKKGKFQTISKELYIDTLIKALKIINNDIIVQRISAGIDDETLLAPVWCKNKQEFLRDARARLRLEAIEY